MRKMAGAGLRLRADLHTHSTYSDGFYAPTKCAAGRRRTAWSSFRSPITTP